MAQVPEPVAALLFYDDHKDGHLKKFQFKDEVRKWVEPRVEAWTTDFRNERGWPQEWEEDKDAWREARDRLYKLHDLVERGIAGPTEVIDALFPRDSEGPAAQALRDHMYPGTGVDDSSPGPSTTQATPSRHESPEGASTPKTAVVARSREGDDASLLSESPTPQPKTPSRGLLNRFADWARTPNRDPSPNSPVADAPSTADNTTHDDSVFSNDDDHNESMTPIERRTPAAQGKPDTAIYPPKEAVTQAPTEANISSLLHPESGSLNESGISPERHTQTEESQREREVSRDPDRSTQPRERSPTRPGASRHTKSPSPQVANNLGSQPRQGAHDNEALVSNIRSRAPPRPGASRHTKSPSPQVANSQPRQDPRDNEALVSNIRSRAPPRPGASRHTKSPSPQVANTLGSQPRQGAHDNEALVSNIRSRAPPRPGASRHTKSPSPQTADDQPRQDPSATTGESSQSVQQLVEQQQQQIASLIEMVNNFSIAQPQQVLSRTKVKVIPTNYDRFYLPTGKNKPVPLSKPRSAHRFPNFIPQQWFEDDRIRQLAVQMRGALDNNFLAINYLRPGNFSQCSSIQTNLDYWFRIPDPDVTPSYVAARARGDVDDEGRKVGDDGLPITQRRYAWACALGFNRKKQLVLEMEGLDGRPFSRCRTTNDPKLKEKFRDLIGEGNSELLPWVKDEELTNLTKEELWINRAYVAPDNGSNRPNTGFEILVWNAELERPCFKWTGLTDLQKRFGADTKVMIQNVVARDVNQPDIW